MKVKIKLRKPKKRDLRNAVDRQANRRTESRSDVRVEVDLDQLQVNVGVPSMSPIDGIVLNISRGGMKVFLDEDEIPKPLIGEDCLVFFVEDPQGRLSEKVKPGRVLRMEAVGHYAIEFDRPLETLNMRSDPETVESGPEVIRAATR